MFQNFILNLSLLKNKISTYISQLSWTLAANKAPSAGCCSRSSLLSHKTLDDKLHEGNPSSDWKYNCGTLTPAAAFLQTCYVTIPWRSPSFSFLFGETALQGLQRLQLILCSWTASPVTCWAPAPKEAWPG